MSNIDLSKMITMESKVSTKRGNLTDELSLVRKNWENKGVELISGVIVDTSDKTYNRLTMALADVKSGVITAPVPWKLSDGWVELTEFELEQATTLIVRHIRKCFEAEKFVYEQLQDLESTDLEKFDTEVAFEEAIRSL